MSKAERRHHRERLKKKCKNYWGLGNHREAPTGRMLGILVNTPKRCSCFMCRNRRQDEGETVQERRHKESNTVVGVSE